MNTTNTLASDEGEKQYAGKDIAVAIPCYNEAVTISKVVKDFQKALPNAAVYVFDNNSTDGSAELAQTAGAVVHYVYCSNVKAVSICIPITAWTSVNLQIECVKFTTRNQFFWSM